MKNYIIIFFSLFLLPSCVRTIGETPTPSNRPHIEIIPFSEIDLNEDGNITEKEFEIAKDVARSSDATNFKEPILTFAGIMVVVGLLILLSSFLNKKNRKNNVGS
jgi:hypothetical protein